MNLSDINVLIDKSDNDFEFNANSIFIQSNIDKWSNDVKTIMGYRGFCSNSLPKEGKKKHRIKQDTYEYTKHKELFEREFEGANNPFYNQKLSMFAITLREVYVNFIKNYKIDSAGLKGDFYAEFLNHIDPFKHNYDKKYSDHYFHQINVAYMGWKILTEPHKFILKIGENNYTNIKSYLINRVRELIHIKEGCDLSEWVNNTNNYLEQAGENKITEDEKLFAIVKEIWLLSSLYHDIGFSFLALQKIRNRILPGFYSLFRSSQYFPYFGEKRDEICDRCGCETPPEKCRNNITVSVPRNRLIDTDKLKETFYSYTEEELVNHLFNADFPKTLQKYLEYTDKLQSEESNISRSYAVGCSKQQNGLLK